MKRFWKGFAIGAAAGAGAGVGSLLLGHAVRRSSTRNIIRIDKSLQVGQPVAEVFAAFSDLERLPSRIPRIVRLRSNAETSHWQVKVGGRLVEFDAEIIQYVDGEAIGWKSVTGPKHTGRINFSPVGTDTLLNVVMNYYPVPGIVAALVHPIAGLLDESVEQALRDFKASLEGKGQERVIGERQGAEQRTGTYGGREPLLQRETGISEPGGPVEWTRPTNAPSTYSGSPKPARRKPKS